MSQEDDHPTAARKPAGTIATVEAVGKTWTSKSEDYLVGYTASFGGNDAGSQMPAVIEMQRRLLVSIGKFSRTSTWLTVAMLALTVVIGAIAGLQLWAMLT